MSRSFELTAESPNTAERVHAAFRDETYWRARIVAFDAGDPTLESVSTDGDGVTTVTVSMSFGVSQLPPPLNHLPGGGALRIVQTEVWHASDDGVVHGRITVTAPGAPVSGHGDLTVTPVGSGSRMTGRGTVDVRVPLIGSTIAGFVSAQLVSGIRDIHVFTDTWIAGEDGR